MCVPCIVSFATIKLIKFRYKLKNVQGEKHRFYKFAGGKLIKNIEDHYFRRTKNFYGDPSFD